MGVDYGVSFTAVDGVLCGLEMTDPDFIRIGLNLVRLRVKKVDIIAIDRLSGRQFEDFLDKLLPRLGFSNTKRMPLSGDFGGDMLASKDGKTFVIQAKRLCRTVGVRAVQEAHTAKQYYGANTAMVISNRAFSLRARKLAQRCECLLVDRDALGQLLAGKFASSAELFDFIAEQRISRFRVSNEELVHAYRSLREQLARQVRISDIDDLGQYSSSAYRKRWGSWSRFLEAVGDPPILRRGISKSDLVESFERAKAHFGKTPTRFQYSAISPYSVSQYERRWGSWNGFLEAIGETPAKRHLISKEAFISEFKRVRLKLKKTPTVRDMAEHGNIAPTTYRRLWRNWSEFLKAMGEPYQHRNIPEQELIAAYLKLKKQLKKDVLTQRDMSEYGRFSSTVYERRWGSWRKFLSTIDSQEDS